MVRRRKPVWPEWWEWPLVMSDHVERRMEQRGFSEVDLRAMLSRATAFRPGELEGRFVVECRWKRQAWKVVVEPQPASRTLVVVTAFSESTT